MEIGLPKTVISMVNMEGGNPTAAAIAFPIDLLKTSFFFKYFTSFSDFIENSTSKIMSVSFTRCLIYKLNKKKREKAYRAKDKDVLRGRPTLRLKKK